MPHKRFQIQVNPDEGIEVQFNYDFGPDFVPTVSNILLHSNYQYSFPPNPTLVYKHGKYFLESHFMNTEGKNMIELHDDPISQQIIKGIQNIIEQETPRFGKDIS